MISCNIQTISYTNCILTIQDSGGVTINEFMLSNLKMFQNDTMETLYLNDSSTDITINLSQLPSINGGAFATLLDLFNYIETQRNLCQCGCGGGGGSGTVTSVDLTMPSAFSVSGNPITTAGTLAVVGAGTTNQYVRGDGSLGNFPSTGGGGASQSYYLNGGTNQGVFVGNTYYEMSKTAVIGVGADFNIAADGVIARFLTDAGDPALLNIPAGNWNFEMYFSANSSGGTPTFYVTLLKYDGASFTTIATSSGTPEGITNGTAIDLYFTSLAVPATTLALTDRLAISIYVVHSGRTITLHTQDSHLGQIITTFSTGISALNGLTDNVQSFATGTSGTDFGISSAAGVHTFNLPTASSTKRGLLSLTDWSIFNGKQAALGFTPEDVSNKTNTVVGNETSTTKYLSVKGYYDYLVGLVWLTAQLFGTWMFGLSAKTTPVNADSIVISDSADSNKAKNLTFNNLKAALKTYFDTIYTTTTAVATQITTALAPYGLIANRIDQNNAATTSAQLASVISDETGTGALVFGTGPTLSGPIVGTQSALDNSTKAASTAYTDAAVALAPNQIFSAPSATVVALTTSFFFLSGSTIGSTTESNRFMYMAKAGTFKNLYIYTVTSQPATGSCVITVRINGVDSALTLTIAAGSAPGVFSNLINSVNYAAGDRVTLKVVNNATATASAQINSTSIQG